jgi:endonuclease/exonuclease/phosphatase family metal-dependent hydrolase
VPTVPDLKMATWNLKTFPLSPSAPVLAADVIEDLDLDLVAVQELWTPNALEALLAALDGYDGVIYPGGMGETHRLGFVWRTDVLELEWSEELLPGDESFPREPVHGRFTTVGGAMDFSAITVHLKAGLSSADEERRVQAAADLEDYVSHTLRVDETEVVILGDFNEAMSDPRSDEVFGVFETAGYQHLTADLPADDASFIPSGVTLDHVVVTGEFADAVGDQVQVPHVDENVPQYLELVSDHRPVVLH